MPPVELTFLIVHICGGILGLLSGAAAIIFRKGSRGHRLAGKGFVGAMLGLTVSGMYLAVTKHQTANFLGGAVTFYLVLTSWATSRNRDGRTSLFDWSFLLVGLAVAATEVTFGIEARMSSNGVKDGYPALVYFIFGSVMLLCVSGDLRMLALGGLSGGHRIARHLWRMLFALLIAAFSFFPGQVKLFPDSVRAIKVLYLPHFFIVGLIFYWLYRVLQRPGVIANQRHPAAIRYSVEG